MTNTTEMKSWATLKSNTPFNHLFPDGRVPVVSPLPIRPQGETSPPCYMVDAKFLTNEQIQGLAEKLYRDHSLQFESIEHAKTYIQEGFPLKCDWFTGFTSTDQGLALSLIDLGNLLEE